MPRGRWVFDEELSGAMWQQVLRGRRPPSVQWPQRRNQSAAVQPLQTPQNAQRPNRGRWQGQGGKSRPPTDHAESRTPDDDAAVLQSRIEKLEKAIEVLGEENPEAQWLGVEESSEPSHIVTNGILARPSWNVPGGV